MAEEQPSLHIDTDWKKQAQEEKKRLAEQSARDRSPAAAAAPTLAPAGGLPSAPASSPGRSPARRGGRELPPPGFAAIVQSMMTQILYYLGDLATPNSQPIVDLDMAKYQLDNLTALEDKSKDNLDDHEKSLLDAALYETRSRFINVASQMLGP